MKLSLERPITLSSLDVHLPNSITPSLFRVWACSPWLPPPSVRCSEEKENNFYSSDSDFDDEEPKKFHIQIRPVASSNRSNSAATEKELKATVGALTLPPNRGVRQQVVLVLFFSCRVHMFFRIPDTNIFSKTLRNLKLCGKYSKSRCPLLR